MELKEHKSALAALATLGVTAVAAGATAIVKIRKKRKQREREQQADAEGRLTVDQMMVYNEAVRAFITLNNRIYELRQYRDELQPLINWLANDSEQPEVKKAAPYKYEPNSEHFVMIVCDSKSVRIDPLMVRISDFNKKEHRTRSFNVRNVMLDDDHNLISIGLFDNEKKASDYIASMFVGDYVFGGIDKSKYTIVPISIMNYPVFYETKDLEEYQTFIESNK